MFKILQLFFWALLWSFPANSKPYDAPSSTAKTNIETIGKTANPTSSSTEQLQQQIRQLQNDLNVTKEHDSLILQAKGLEDLENRVEDIHQHVTYWGSSIALFASLIMTLVIFITFRAYREAVAEASQIIKNCIDKEGFKIIEPFKDSLQKQGQEIFIDMRQQSAKTFENINNKSSQQQQRLTELEKQFSSLIEKSGKAIEPIKDSLQKQGQELFTEVRQQGAETFKSINNKVDQYQQRLGDLEKQFSMLIENNSKAIEPIKDTLQKQGLQIFTDIRQQGAETLENINSKADQRQQRLSDLEKQFSTIIEVIGSLKDELQQQGQQIINNIHQQGTDTLKNINNTADQHHQRLCDLEKQFGSIIQNSGKIIEPLQDTLQKQGQQILAGMRYEPLKNIESIAMQHPPQQNDLEHRETPLIDDLTPPENALNAEEYNTLQRKTRRLKRKPEG